jgi:hypothetical protein
MEKNSTRTSAIFTFSCQRGLRSSASIIGIAQNWTDCRALFRSLAMTLLIALFLISQPSLSLAADTTEKKTDLSTVNWDTEEEEDSKDKEANKVENNLSTTSWEDEETDATQDAENAAADQKQKDEFVVIEKQERIVQIAGFGVFCIYLFGMLLTAYFTRNRKLAVNYSPELLILLHAFWPLQWLLLPFFGQKVR